MKKLLFIITTVFIFFQVNAQFTIQQSLGSKGTLVIVKGGLHPDIVFTTPVFTDTTAANLEPTPKLYPGNIIRVANDLWMRSDDGTIWIQLNGGGGGGSNNYPTALSFDETTGNLTLNRNGLSALVENLDGRYLITRSTLQQVFNTEVGGSLLTKPDTILAHDFQLRLHVNPYNSGFQDLNTYKIYANDSNLTNIGAGAMRLYRTSFPDITFLSKAHSGTGSATQFAIGYDYNASSLFKHSYWDLRDSANFNIERNGTSTAQFFYAGRTNLGILGNVIIWGTDATNTTANTTEGGIGFQVFKDTWFGDGIYTKDGVLPVSSSSTDSVWVRDPSTGRSKLRAQSAIGVTTPTWEQTLSVTGGHTLSTNHNVVYSGTKFNMLGARTTGGVPSTKSRVEFNLDPQISGSSITGSIQATDSAGNNGLIYLSPYTSYLSTTAAGGDNAGFVANENSGNYTAQIQAQNGIIQSQFFLDNSKLRLYFTDNTNQTLLDINNDSVVLAKDEFTGNWQTLNLAIRKLPSATAANVLYYDPSNGRVTYGTASAAVPGIDDVLAVGQSLTANRSINALTRTLTITGSAGSNLLSVSNTGSGYALSITSNSLGIDIVSTDQAALFTSNFSANSTVLPVFELRRTTSNGSFGAAGIGARLDFTLEASDGAAYPSNQIISKFTTATAGSRVSQLILKGVNSAVLADLFTLNGNGSLQFNKYGINTFAGTPAYSLGVDASGNVVEFTAGGGSGHTIQEEGSPLTARTNLNFIGSGITAADDAGNNATTVTLDADLNTISGLTATTDNFIVSVSSAWASRTPAQVRTTLGLVVGTDVQAFDADLTTWAGLTPTTVGQNLVTLTNPSALGYIRVNADNTVTHRSYANVRTDLGLVIGTDVQAFDADLTDFPSQTGNSGKVLSTNGSALSWVSAGAGDVIKVGTPVDNQVGVWTGNGTIEGSTGLTYDNIALKIISDNATGLILTSGTANNYTDIRNDDEDEAIRMYAGTTYAGSGGAFQMWGASSAIPGVYFDAGSVSGANIRFRNSTSGSTKLQIIQGGSVQVEDYIDIKEITAPGTPGGGYGRVYVSSSDSKPHFITDGGTDYDLTATGGSGITIGTTPITGGTDTRILRNNAGVVDEYVAASGATASSVVLRDANANITANNWLGGYTTTATAAGTTTLTIGSTYLQYFTGSTTQIVQLPVVSTLALGTQYIIVNLSSGNVTVNSSGGNAVIVLANNTWANVTSIATTGTDATVWDKTYFGVNIASGKKVTWNNSLTMSGTDGTTMTFPSTSQDVVGRTETQTLTNKRITKRTGTVASSATPTINTDNVDFYSITALAANISSFTTNLSGTPTDGQFLWIAITDNGTARTIAWGASFEASTVPLPTTTVISTRLDVGFVWNASTSKWRCVAVQ